MIFCAVSSGTYTRSSGFETALPPFGATTPITVKLTSLSENIFPIGSSPLKRSFALFEPITATRARPVFSSAVKNLPALKSFFSTLIKSAETP